MDKLNFGKIHIYYGNGKGKTSILNGMAIRALGAGHKVCYVRFLKNQETSENKVLEQLGIPVHNFYHFSKKFIWEMNEEEQKQFKIESQKGFEFLKAQLQNPQWDLILIDELLGAIENQFIDLTELISALNNRVSHQEVALSGRPYFSQLNEVADLVSEIKEVKHYFAQQIPPRKGIEY